MGGRKRRLWSLLVAVGLLMALLPVSGALADHGVPTDQDNCPLEGEDGDTKVDGADVDQDFVPEAGTHICIKGGQTIVFVTADGESTIKELLGTGQNVSHYTIIQRPPEFEPEGALAVTKTAEASYDLSHAWDIDKNADLTALDLAVDGSGDAEVTWTIDVTYEGSTISNESVTGEITLDNSGNVDARIDTLTDVLDTGEEGTVDCPEDLPFVVPAGEQMVCTYEVDASGVDVESTNGNTATASGVFASDEAGENFDGDAIDEFGEAEVNFILGTETDATVSVSDDTGGAAEVFLGTATAPDDAQFQYSQSFAYADFGQESCGTHTINNTATIDQTGQSDDETVVINVQCLVFQGETATGFGLPWSATQKATSNWFMYSEWSDIAEGGADIIAGQHFDIGDVTGTRNGTTTLNFSLSGDWELADVANNVKINSMSCTTGQKYKQPGQFAVKVTVDPDDSGSFSVSGLSNTACYGIHLDVGQWVPDPSF